MAKDTDEIRVGANGSILVAPIGSDLPTDISDPFSADWIDLGFTDENGATITDSRTLQSIPVWQLFYPARRIVTERDLTITTVLRQWGPDQVTLAFGGGTITADSTGKFRYTPPAPDFIDERMFAVEWKDGPITYRWILHRCMITDNVQTKVVRSAAADLPITVGILGEDGVDPWFLLTDDPAYASAAS